MIFPCLIDYDVAEAAECGLISTTAATTTATTSTESTSTTTTADTTTTTTTTTPAPEPKPETEPSVRIVNPFRKIITIPEVPAEEITEVAATEEPQETTTEDASLSDCESGECSPEEEEENYEGEKEVVAAQAVAPAAESLVASTAAPTTGCNTSCCSRTQVYNGPVFVGSTKGTSAVMPFPMYPMYYPPTQQPCQRKYADKLKRIEAMLEQLKKAKSCGDKTTAAPTS